MVIMLWFALLAHPALAADLFVRWPEHTERDEWGNSYGIGVSDLDGDGYTDVVVPGSGVAWHNDGGVGWSSVPIPELAGQSQYSVSMGDYDADGLPDISTEPRGSAGRLLHNVGDLDFEQLPQDQFPGVPGQSAETNGWVDVDGDGWLDLFVPAYYGDSGLYMNLGPDADGDHSFREALTEAGIILSTTSAYRPEGAQFADVDRDGDADLYVCGELLHNLSTPGAPLFRTDTTNGLPPAFDEGAAFADIDMDGDFDLGVVYHDQNWTDDLPQFVFLVWENLGDATYEMRPPESVQDINIGDGYNLGMSWIDWDHDGDMDVTFSNRFEQNVFNETGEAEFFLIDSETAQANATPGWMDWDHDGDLDIALGVWAGETQFFENVLYDGVPLEERRYLRVRPVTASDALPLGTDTEFGATVDVRLHSDPAEIRRRQFTASGHGYLNQSEYTLSFGFEGVEAPVADVAVEFTTPGADGVWRVDRHVNPALGDLDVLALADREVRVFRDGRAIVDGVEHDPTGGDDVLLQTVGELYHPKVTDALDELPGAWVGLQFEVPLDEADPEHGIAIRELQVDGVLAEPISCGDVDGNVLLWDITSGDMDLVDAATGPIHPRNRRAEIPVGFELPGGRTYRVAARVDARRVYAVGEQNTRIEVRGGFEVPDGDPCDPAFMDGVALYNNATSLTVRYRDRQVPQPVEDTGDTGDTEETDDPVPDTAGDTAPWTDDEKLVGGSCGCAAGSAGGAGWLALVALAWRRRRR